MEEEAPHLRGLFDTPAAAKYVGLGANTMRYYRGSGIGPSYLKIGRNVFYKKDDLDAWVAQRTRRHVISSSVSSPSQAPAR